MSEVEQPPRPYVAPICVALPGALLAAWFVLGGLGSGYLRGMCILLAAGVLAGLFCLRLSTSAGAGALIAIVCCAALGATISAASALKAEHGSAQALSENSISTWEFVVRSASSEGRFGWSCQAEARQAGKAFGLVWLRSSVPFERGECVRGVGSFTANGADEWGQNLARRGIAGTVSLKHVSSHTQETGVRGILDKFHDTLVSSLDPMHSEGRALMAGALCGDREALKHFGLDEAFSSCGLAHLVAVSGSHLSTISSLLALALARARLQPRARFTILAALTGVFVVFCGAPASAVRAWCMSLAGFGAALSGRRNHAPSAVALVALGMCLVRPSCVGDVGFLLSVASVMGLCLFSSYMNYLVDVCLQHPYHPRRLPPQAARLVRSLSRNVKLSFVATCVAQLATLPITVATFGCISLVAPISNIVIGPLFSVALAFGAVVLVAAPVPVVGSLLCAAGDAVFGLICWLVRRFAALPLCSLAVVSDGIKEWVAILALGVVLLVWWPRISRRFVVGACSAALSVVLALCIQWRFFAPARVVVLDVGQGDAILIQDGAHALLIDCGPAGEITAALAREHVFHLDAILITHMHDDHYAGLAELDGFCEVSEVFVGEGARASEPAELADAIDDLEARQTELAYGDKLRCGGFRARVVSPTEPRDGTENADSVELVLDYGPASSPAVFQMLLTGDAEQDEMAGLLERGDVGAIDVLKVGHHGSEVSLTPEQAQLLSPALSVASAGEGNRYGHPTRACQEALEAAGSLFVCTKDVGDVCIKPSNEGIRMSCSRATSEELRSLAAVS